MDLILNGHPHLLDTSDCANLAELIEVIERVDANAEACVVVSVEVDGEPLSPDALSGLEAHSLDGVARVAIQRQSTRAVAISVLAQAAEYTGRIVQAIGEAVAHFRAGRSDLGSGVLADVTDSLTVLTGISYSVASVFADESRQLAEMQSQLFPWLQELVEAQVDEDPIRIGDLLEYEIAPRIEEWGSVMRALTMGDAIPARGGVPTRSN